MSKGKMYELIRIRVTEPLKDALRGVADVRGEGESVIVREALNVYFARATRQWWAKLPRVRKLLAALQESERGNNK